MKKVDSIKAEKVTISFVCKSYPYKMMEHLQKIRLLKAEKQEEVVLVNYRLKDEQWVFDGSNSLLQAAMLGYLKSPDEMTE